jgi:hypothetical protein
MGGRNKRWRKSKRRIVERALGLGDSCSVSGDDDEDFPSFEEWCNGTVFGVCPCCNSELVKYVDGFGCPHGCVFVPFPK